MQTITFAIGTSGIQYFVQQMLVKDLATALSNLKPPAREISVPEFSTQGFGWSAFISAVVINLSNGSLSEFSPSFQALVQNANGQFSLTLVANNFSVHYSWAESYYECLTSIGAGSSPNTKCFSGSGSYHYSPEFASLNVPVVLQFQYNKTTSSYDVTVVSANCTTAGESANIPSGSVIQNEDPDCFSGHVSDATASAVSAIDFSTPINSIFPPLLHSIPASGQLTTDITYEFALGDSGLTFPGDSGIAVGVTGRVSYKGTFYSATPPAALPLPPIPTDKLHHLQTYVSDYEINALHWAYFQAGLLSATVQASDLPDPDALKVRTYVPAIPAFKPFASFAMQAQINPKEPPSASFQLVYELTTSVMTLLQQQLPSNVYQQVSGLSGNAYVKQADLETDLSGAGVSSTYLAQIEKAARAMGMAVIHNLEFTLTILNGETTPPVLVFDLLRTDILTNLGLGLSGTAQTLKYAFLKTTTPGAVATFVSTTVPKFDKQDFGDMIWPIAGEPQYDQTLQQLGQTGVPLPIMQGFQFLFEEAVLSIQQGYVSVLANVEFKS